LGIASVAGYSARYESCAPRTESDQAVHIGPVAVVRELSARRRHIDAANRTGAGS
jgi:acetyl/propionyl-CoA carboxylase alpha subunit